MAAVNYGDVIIISLVLIVCMELGVGRTTSRAQTATLHQFEGTKLSSFSYYSLL